MEKLKMKKPYFTIKLKEDFEECLQSIYNIYVLEDDKNLDEGAKELKDHYKYVIEDMLQLDCLEIKKERRDLKCQRYK